ncbi:DNA internalization-related competence protein ComEC/Rec2 [Gilvimarinus sp. SDUM040013]|uniref:DNA internalization-related competence protein ComEC/Rec2 n=1 Tax=Gilvimarinus gilvus TaxID=3058038 RepID=A0ABU4S1J7_9GAMM|nr:DNA internalization-related competence protein ComEC/Rec2 [Gilvimarinus sp. SDUM040013]MDO3387152.1 DNA internalization-related competence protein ComEC/Rec2 [Gilvimarinus sp. SDUM040013]MDX6850895.1 DNA internalization-related competence protein ComEC/Rec2 [Gilvimarinus sp. SDUM040013]
MYPFALTFIGSLLVVAFAPALPPSSLLFVSVFTLLTLSFCWPQARPYLLGLCLGWVLAVWHGTSLVENQLAQSKVGQDLNITGKLATTAQRQGRRWRFDFAPESPGLPSLVQVSWYEAPAWVADIQKGDQLHLVLRLKRLRSFVNPVGFDYKLWQLRRGVGAVGYVRSGKKGASAIPHRATIKDRLSVWLNRAPIHNRDVLRALLLGDRSEISEQRWVLFRQTGTNHLMAISGLHIGLAAAMGYVIGLCIGRVASLWLPWPAVFWGFVGGGIMAAGYAALAGFALPTQRALAMLLLFYFWRWRGTPIPALQILVAALVIVGALDPLAVVDAGLWLSFVAVFALVLIFSGQSFVKANRWLPWVGSQLAVFVALLVPLLIFFGEFSWVAPLANILAIALVSFWVVPALFVSALCFELWPGLSELLLQGADWGLQLLWWWLATLVDTASRFGLPATAQIKLAEGALPALAMACLLLLLPRAFNLRPLAMMLLLVVISVPKVREPLFAMTVLDVGQGLAVVVRSQDKTLVYDTGPWFGESFNAGADIIAPFLQAKGAANVDVLVVSHAHRDHAGGAAGLIERMPVASLLVGESLPYLSAQDEGRARSCHQQTPLRLGEVELTFVALPGQGRADLTGNNASCVVLVRWRSKQILLPGDIENPLEAALARELGSIDWIVAPHHGSRSSSTAVLLDKLQPAHVIFSTGFNNRHNHPHPDVVARYEQNGAQSYNTATDGAVQIIGNKHGELVAQRWRHRDRRYWRN